MENECLKLKSTSISRIDFLKKPGVTELQRTSKVVDDSTLWQTVLMATTKTALTKHLEAKKLSKLSRNRKIYLLTEFPCFVCKHSLMVVAKVIPIGIRIKRQTLLVRFFFLFPYTLDLYILK